MAAEVFVALVMRCEWEWELCSRTEAVGTSCLVVERRVRGRVERLVQQCLVTGRLVGVEEAEVDHAVLAVAWDVVVEDLPNFGVVWEAEVEAEEGEEEGEEGEGEVEDFEVAQVVEAVEGEGEEEVGSAGAVPGFAPDEQHVMGLVEPGDPCDRGESPG